MSDIKDFFETYCDFVTKVTSEPSLNIEDLRKKMENKRKSTSNNKKSVKLENNELQSNKI